MAVDSFWITLLLVGAVVLVPTIGFAIVEAWRRNHGRPRW